MKYLLILICATLFAAEFDLSKLDTGNIYHYRLDDDDAKYTIIRHLSIEGGILEMNTRKIKDDGEVMLMKGKTKLDGSPISSKYMDGDGNITCSTLYDYSKKEVYMDKEGKNKTISLKENPLDGMTLEIAVGGMDVPKYECNGYSCQRQGSAGMSVEKKGRERVTVPAGTFETEKTEHTFDGLLSLVIPTITYWHDIESGHCVRLKAGDSVKELVKIEKKSIY